FQTSAARRAPPTGRRRRCAYPQRRFRVPWFRLRKRKQTEEQVQAKPAAPKEQDPAAEEPAPEGAATAKPKRRRGSRGGRGRKESTTTTTTEPKAEKPKAEK